MGQASEVLHDHVDLLSIARGIKALFRGNVIFLVDIIAPFANGDKLSILICQKLDCSSSHFCQVALVGDLEGPSYNPPDPGN